MVRKAMSKVKGSYIVSTPKTSTFRRIVQMPPFFEDELSSLMYAKGTAPDERIFPFTHYKMRRHLRGSGERMGLPRICIHDLRYSHVSLLIDLGFPAPAIAERIGHSSISITYTYAHLFPVRQHDMSNALEAEEGIR